MRRLVRVIALAIPITVSISLSTGAMEQNKGQWKEEANGAWSYYEENVPLADAHIENWYVSVSGTYIKQSEEIQILNKLISSYSEGTREYVLTCSLGTITRAKSLIDSYIGRASLIWYYSDSLTTFYIYKEDVDSLYTNYRQVGEYMRQYDNRILTKLTQRERAIEIANIIIENFEYDYSLQNLTIDKLVATGTGVCYGYSLLFERMCAMYGIECYEVRGYVLQPNTSRVYHSWNEVVIDGVTEVWDITFADTSTYTARYLNIQEPIKSQYYKE